MKKYSRQILLTLALTLFLLSCGRVETIPVTPTEEKESTPTVSLELTASPTIAVTSTPTLTPFPTTFTDATVQAFDSILCNSKVITWWEVSPNGKWLTAGCYREAGTEDSPLLVSSIGGKKNWKIYVRDYKKEEYDRHDSPTPYHWSKDGRFLYLTVSSRFEGCCWIGRWYVLVLRLNLETGEQTALLNTKRFSDAAFDLIISDSDRYLLFTPSSNQPYDFALLDFQTWETHQFFLKPQKDININYAKISPSDDKVILPLYKNIEFNDYYVDSIALINLTSGQQKILIADLTPENELFPIRWIDNSHVLLSNINPVYYAGDLKEKHWLLDINSGKLEEETP